MLIFPDFPRPDSVLGPSQVVGQLRGKMSKRLLDLSGIKLVNKRINALTYINEAAFAPSCHGGSSAPTLGATPACKGAISLSIKDNINVSGMPTTCASRMLAGFIPETDAAVISLLKAHLDCRIIGKANMDEFGMGSHSLNSYHGPVINPLYACSMDKDGDWGSYFADQTSHAPATTVASAETFRSAGGSSGGSAASVSSSMCNLSLGSDTGGSVRLPAAYCQLVGFKPSYGRISRNGLVAYASSLDTIGMISDDLALIRTVFDTVKHKPEHPTTDMTCISLSTRPDVPDKRLQLPSARPMLRGIKIGLPDELCLGIDMDKAVVDGFEEFKSHLKDLGATLVPISMPQLQSSLLTYYIIALVEASSCLARYPGKYFPSIAPAANNFGAHSFGPVVKQRIALGSLLGINYYLEAVKVRNGIGTCFVEAFNQQVDLIISPTAPTLPPPLSTLMSSSNTDLWSPDRWEPLLEQYQQVLDIKLLPELSSDLLTVPASLARIPAISLPFKGIGIQLMAPHLQDDYLLSLSEDILNRDG